MSHDFPPAHLRNGFVYETFSLGIFITPQNEVMKKTTYLAHCYPNYSIFDKICNTISLCGR